MTETLDHAIAILRSLPESVQEAAARAVIDGAASLEDEVAAA